MGPSPLPGGKEQVRSRESTVGGVTPVNGPHASYEVTF